MILDKYPIVTIDRKLEKIPTSFVGVDNIAAARTAVEFLFDNGHKNISVITQSNIHNSSITSRLSGIRESHAVNGIALNENIWINDLVSDYTCAPGSESVERNIAVIMRTLERYPQITGLLSLSNHCAELVMEAVCRMKKKIPDDYSLLSFDTPTTIFSKANITHIAQHEALIGKRAVNILLEKIRHPESDIIESIIDTTLVDNGTVRKI